MRHHRKDRASEALARVSQALETTPAERTELVLTIGARRKGASPGAIAIEADCVAAWRRHSFGSAKSILPTRNAVYSREISTGLRTMAIRDVCDAIADGGVIGLAAARATVDALALAIEEADKKSSLVESRDTAIAHFARESSDVSIARLKNKSDEELLREVDEAIDSGKHLKAVICAKAGIRAATGKKAAK